jgi:hypothetical protein
MSLPRPEYPAIPEAFLSALAWKAFLPSDLPTPVEGKKLGLRFWSDTPKEVGKSFETFETRPRDGKLQSLQDNLATRGFRSVEHNSQVGEALINSVVGTSKSQGRFVPASPLTPSLALMQNLIGVLGKAGPPDIAKILETIYAIGHKGSPHTTVAALYAQAAKHRLKNDLVLSKIDAALSEDTWGGVSEVKLETLKVSSSLFDHLEDTPFTWFAQTWDKITSPEWVSVLPARIWVDWATSVLRSAYAMTYLWEASWFDTVGRVVLSDIPHDRITFALLRQRMDAPLVWKPSGTPVEIRDVSSKLKWRCERGVLVRKILEDFIDGAGYGNESLARLVKDVRTNSKTVESIRAAMNPTKSAKATSSKLLWEAIRYSLQTRGSDDYYGLLETRGNRYLFANPGMEWCAMVASLSSSNPGVKTNLGEVLRNLGAMGIKTDSSELLSQLERAGLARGSADADLAVEVQTAFGRSHS